MLKKTQKAEENNIGTDQIDAMAILSYVGFLCLVPLLWDRQNKFAQFHAKQGLVLFFAELATIAIAWIPILGWLVGFFAWILWTILAIIGIVNVLRGNENELPVLGKCAKRFKI